jgi:phosphate transport system ATP-binding protein
MVTPDTKIENVKFDVRRLNVWFAKEQAIKDLSLQVYKNEIFSIIGPANSGKTSFLYCLNRLNDLNSTFRINGAALMDGDDIYLYRDVEQLRKRVGIVFALPTPLPLSIFDNIAYGPRMSGIKKYSALMEIVEKSLKESYLWEEVKDRLNMSAFNLSGGQQQRLCISRILALNPEAILFDEPTSGLDPISTAKVEEAMLILKQKYTIILVTNNVAQAARVGDRTAFFLMGDLIELDNTKKIFTSPKEKRTEDYITGKFG